LNRFLLGRTGGEKYATVFYCLLDLDGRLSYVNAAQCPPLIVRENAAPLELATTGMPVGLMDPATFELAEFQLCDRDKVVMYSDGVTEAANTAGEFFGKKRLRAILAEHRDSSCTELHDAIQSAVSAFTEDAAQSDDITVVVLEYRR